MLVLGRKVKEGILVGRDIQVTVLEIVGNEVKLGIEAPREVPIFRNEVIQDVKEENRRAARTASVVALKELATIARPRVGGQPTLDQEEKCATMARG